MGGEKWGVAFVKGIITIAERESKRIARTAAARVDSKYIHPIDAYDRSYLFFFLSFSFFFSLSLWKWKKQLIGTGIYVYVLQRRC